LIPLQDDTRRAVRIPVVRVAIIAVNVLVFLLELAGGQTSVKHWALVPAELVGGRHWIALLTAMFLHGGWLHLLTNMLFVWVFGSVLEDAIRGKRYLFFMGSAELSQLSRRSSGRYQRFRFWEPAE
jgi:membrane associated rhomboid family serine protease